MGNVKNDYLVVDVEKFVEQASSAGCVKTVKPVFIEVVNTWTSLHPNPLWRVLARLLRPWVSTIDHHKKRIHKWPLYRVIDNEGFYLAYFRKPGFERKFSHTEIWVDVGFTSIEVRLSAEQEKQK